MSTTTPETESLEQRLTRQDRERNQLVTVEQDKLDQKVTEAEAAEIAAAKADDEPARQKARKAKAKLLDEKRELLDAIAAKEHAIEQTKHDITARDRAAAVREMQAHAATAAEIAPQVDECRDALCEAARRLKGQLDGAYGVAVNRLGESATSFAAVTGTQRLYDDLCWHLAGALGLQRGAAVHGGAVEQTADLTVYAETIR